MTAPPDELPALAAAIPPDVLESLRRYAVNHVPTGGFLAAVLRNDLFEAVGRADHVNQHFLPAICQYIFNCLPLACWGSAEKVEAWTRIRVVEDGVLSEGER